MSETHFADIFSITTTNVSETYFADIFSIQSAPRYMVCAAVVVAALMFLYRLMTYVTWLHPLATRGLGRCLRVLAFPRGAGSSCPAPVFCLCLLFADFLQQHHPFSGSQFSSRRWRSFVLPGLAAGKLMYFTIRNSTSGRAGVRTSVRRLKRYRPHAAVHSTPNLWFSWDWPGDMPLGSFDAADRWPRLTREQLLTCKVRFAAYSHVVIR